MLFGVVLMVTGIRMLFHDSGEASPERNLLVRLTRRFVPVTRRFHGKHFFVRIDGHRHATPLFLALMAIEMSDIVFAIDSVPAIFALTQRAAHRVHVERVCDPRPALAVFRPRGGGGPILASSIRPGRRADVHRPQDVVAQPVFPITWSLAIIATLVGGSIVASLVVGRRIRLSDEPSEPAAGVPGIREVAILRQGQAAPERDSVAVEEPMEVRVNGDSFAVIMRTPGADRDLAAGFLLAEDVIRGAGRDRDHRVSARTSRTRAATTPST